MPAFIVMQSGKVGEATDAIICDPNVATGHPDKRSAVPVKATMISEKAIRIDEEPRPRAIISAISENGVTTILVGGSTRGPSGSRTARGVGKGFGAVATTRDGIETACRRKRSTGARKRGTTLAL